MKYLITVTLLVALKAASFGQNTTNFAHIGRVDRFETEINQLIPKDAKIELLCDRASGRHRFNRQPRARPSVKGNETPPTHNNRSRGAGGVWTDYVDSRSC